MDRTREYAKFVKMSYYFDDGDRDFSVNTFLWKEMASLIDERIFGSRSFDKTVFEQQGRDFEGQNVSYVDLLRVIHVLEETRTMKSIECDVLQQIDAKCSKYSRRIKSRRREQQKRIRRAEKKG